MEHKFYTDNFERLLKEKSDEFRMYPSKRVWHSIYNDLHPDRKWPSIAVSLVLVTVLFLVGYWNNNLAEPKTTTHQNIAAAPAGTGNTGASRNNQNTTSINTVAANYNTTQAEASPVTTADKNNATGNNTGLAVNSRSNEPVITNNTASAATRQTSSVANKENNITATSNPANRSMFNHRNTAVSSQPFKATITGGLTADQTELAGTAMPVSNPQAVAAAAINKPQSSNTKIIARAGEEQHELTADETASAAINQPDNSSVAPVANNSIMTTGQKLAEKPAVAKLQAATGQLSAEDKSWIENYALYNRQTKNRWKGKLSTEIYFTPGAGLRKLTANTDFALAYPSVMGMQSSSGTTDQLKYHPGATLEAGAGFSYSIAKNIRIKAGVQANFTNYSIDATEMNHPVLTTLLLTDINTGYTYLEGRSSSLANASASNSKRVHNQTSQISLPVGLAVKLAGNGKLEWYAGAAIQPTYVFGGKANLISFDHKNYVADASMLRSWNLNTAFETYIHYKLQGFTLAAGPELRYQLMSTYSRKYTYSENLYNIGLKIGIVKNF